MAALMSLPSFRIVLVSGADSLTGLTTARALTHLPVDIWGAASDERAPACASRVWRHLLITSAEPGACLDTLLLHAPSMVREGWKPILLFSQDALVIEAGRRLAEVREHFDVVLPEAMSIELLMDKTRFHTWASERGYPVPRSSSVANMHELHACLETFEFPCILKPLVRLPAWDSRTKNCKLLFLECREDLELHPLFPELFQLCERYLLQQWIPGGDEDVYFCLFAVSAEGRSLGHFMGRKLAQWPPLSGSTAVCEDVCLPALEQLSEAILLAGGLRGLGSIEYKRHAGSGEFYITEPTVGRNDYQSYVAVSGGVNLTARLVSDMIGQILPAAGACSQRSVVWVDEIACLRYFKASPQRWVLLWRLLRTLLRCRWCGASFMWSDMRPFGALVSRILRSVTSRFFSRP